ncbi:MAG: ribonuclease HII [Calditrichaeota bacterium]|nr:MAG: ribonuclease HII [Calditrichota bacterium]
MAELGAILKKFDFERELWDKGIELVAGTDEVGRGPLAGPVVAAAVILPKGMPVEIPVKIDDSKKLTEKQRIQAYHWIAQTAVSTGIGIVGVADIDKVNIRKASFLAMSRAVSHLQVEPQHILVDGLPMDSPPFPQTAIVKGDQLSISIAAASILAKVVRDEIMKNYYDLKYPEYKFAGHKGYATKAHIEAINEFGRCPIHRRSFRLKNEKQKEMFE